MSESQINFNTENQEQVQAPADNTQSTDQQDPEAEAMLEKIRAMLEDSPFELIAQAALVNDPQTNVVTPQAKMMLVRKDQLQNS